MPVVCHLVIRVKGCWQGGFYPDLNIMKCCDVCYAGRGKWMKSIVQTSGVALAQLVNFDLDVARGQWFLADLSFEGLETLKPIWRNNKSFLYPFGVVASLRETVQKKFTGFYHLSLPQTTKSGVFGGGIFFCNSDKDDTSTFQPFPLFLTPSLGSSGHNGIRRRLAKNVTTSTHCIRVYLFDIVGVKFMFDI